MNNCDSTSSTNVSACDALEKITTADPVTSKCERRSVPNDDVRLNDAIARNEYVLVGRDTCPWCKKALALLQSKNKQVEYLNLETYPDLYSKLATFLNYRYVPIIIHKGAFIGGYSELLNCLTDDTLNSIQIKTNEIKPPVIMPPADSYAQLTVTDPSPKVPCACNTRPVQTAFQDVQVGPSNANKAIEAMNLNQQANLMLNVQQNQQALCQLEEQKRNATVEAQQKANVAQQKMQEAQQAQYCASQTAQNLTQQQQAIQEQQKQVAQAIENTAAQQRAVAQQKIDCQIAQQQSMAAQKAAELAAKTIPITQVQQVQEVPVVATTAATTTAAASTTPCVPDANNPLRMGEPQYVQSQLVVQPMTVTSAC